MNGGPTMANGDDTDRKKILVLGPRKAGKSSCIKTVFQNVPVKDVPFFGVTQRVEKISYDSMVKLQIWDTPPNFEIDQLDVPLGSFSIIVFIIDIQQDDIYHELTARFVSIMLRAYIANPGMKFAVFIHKAESTSPEYRGDIYSEIQRSTTEELEDYPYHTLQPLDPNTNFSDPSVTQGIVNHLMGETRFELTSVHNVSLRDAWGKVLQGVMEMLPAVEELMLNFTASSGMDNSYLFDIRSGVVLATDNRHKNDAALEQVTEYLDRFMQFRDLYKSLKPAPSTSSSRRQAPTDDGDDDEDDGEGANGIDGDEDEQEETGTGEDWWDREDPSQQWLTQSTRLMPNTTISLWQFTPDLALISLLRTDTWQERRGGIEYNLTFLRQGVRQIMMEVGA